MGKALHMAVWSCLLAAAVQAGTADARRLCESASELLKAEGTGGIERALGILERALAEDPGLADAAVAAAQACMLGYELGAARDPAWLDRGLAYLDRMPGQGRMNADALTVRAQMHLDRAQAAEARRCLDEALKLDPAHAGAATTRLAMLLRAGDRKPARAFAREAAERGTFKTRGAVAKVFGKMMLEAGEPGEAAALFRQASEAGLGDDVAVLKGLAMALAQVGQFESAAQAFERAYCFDPKDTVLLAHLALCWEKAGELRKAIQFLEAYLALEPDDPAARKKRRALAAKTTAASEARGP